MKGAALSIQVTQSGAGRWRVDAVKIKSEIGRHSIFPNGFALSDLFDATLVRDIESCLGTLDMERRLLAKPDYVHSTEDLTLKGMWVHLGTGVDAALCAIVSFKELIGNAYTAIRKFAVETVPAALHAAPALPTEAERHVLDSVVLPVMNIADSLMRHITHLNIDRRFEPALAAVHDQCRQILSQHAALSCSSAPARDETGPPPKIAPHPETGAPRSLAAHPGAPSYPNVPSYAGAPGYPEAPDYSGAPSYSGDPSFSGDPSVPRDRGASGYPGAPVQANTLSAPHRQAEGAHAVSAAGPAAPARVLPLLLDQIRHAPPGRPDPD